MWKERKRHQGLLFLENFQICQRWKTKQWRCENETVLEGKVYPFIWTVLHRFNRRNWFFYPKSQPLHIYSIFETWSRFFQFMPLSIICLWRAMKLFYSPLNELCQYAWQREAFKGRANFTLILFMRDPSTGTWKTWLGRFAEKIPTFGWFLARLNIQKEDNCQKWGAKAFWMHSQELKEANFKNSLVTWKEWRSHCKMILKCLIYAAQKDVKQLIIFYGERIRKRESKSPFIERWFYCNLAFAWFKYWNLILVCYKHCWIVTLFSWKLVL